MARGSVRLWQWLAVAATLLAAALWWRGPKVEPTRPPPESRRASGWSQPPRAPASATAELTGEIVDPDGRPIPDARVVVSRYAAVRGRPLSTQKTQAGGAFRFEKLPPGSYTVQAATPGFTAGYRGPIVLDAGDRQQLRLRLWAGDLTLDGRVLDAGGGVIIGARVQATSYGRNANDTHEPRVFQVDSDGDGRYRLQLPAGVHKIRVEADGYAGGGGSIELLSALSRDFALQPAARISGRVISADRQEPIAGAEVVAQPDEWRPSTSTPTVTTNDQGRFVITALPPGGYRITARKDGLLGAFERSVGLDATDAVDDIEIAMRQSVTLRGQVTSVSGRPLGQARLTLSEPDRPTRPFGPSPNALTDDEGRYLFEGVAPGRYRLAVSAADHAAHAEPIALHTAQSHDVVLKNAAVVSGLVLKGNGKPATSAWVRAIVGANDPDRKISGMAMTDSAGRFSIKGLGEGELRLTASDRDEAAAIGPETLGTGSRKELTIRLGAAASIAGVVRWDDGAPITAEAVVIATILGEEAAIASSHRTEEDGSFIVRGLPPGEVALQVLRRRDRGARTTLTLAAGEQRTGVDLVIARR